VRVTARATPAPMSLSGPRAAESSFQGQMRIMRTLKRRPLARGGAGIYYAVLTWRPGYVGAEGKRLYHYVTRKEFDKLSAGNPGAGSRILRPSVRAPGIRRGPQPPGHAGRASGERLHLDGASHVLIEGFESAITDWRARAAVCTWIGPLAAWSGTARFTVCRARFGSAGRKPEGNLVEDCELWDTSIPRWPWAMTKGTRRREGE